IVAGDEWWSTACRRRIVALRSTLYKQYLQHRNLHSFPTRRSSDLLKIDELGVSAGQAGMLPRVGANLSDNRSIQNISQTRSNGRSEEHTSELQSRENLVCRLLLEKKKDRQRASDPTQQRGRASRRA